MLKRRCRLSLVNRFIESKVLHRLLNKLVHFRIGTPAYGPLAAMQGLIRPIVRLDHFLHQLAISVLNLNLTLCLL